MDWKLLHRKIIKYTYIGPKILEYIRPQILEYIMAIHFMVTGLIQ